MKKLISLAIISVFVFSIAFPKDLFTRNVENDGRIEINSPDATFLRVTDTNIDTISVDYLLPHKGELSLICFSENWCNPSYTEFNRLYNDSIIEFLKENETRLIILASKYPFLNINRLDSIASANIESDFEIYYNTNRNDSHIGTFPCLWQIDSKNSIIYHSVGLKEDYSQVRDSLENFINKNHNSCHRCKGTGRIKPNRNGGPDESVGICPWCGGSGHI